MTIGRNIQSVDARPHIPRKTDNASAPPQNQDAPEQKLDLDGDQQTSLKDTDNTSNSKPQIQEKNFADQAVNTVKKNPLTALGATGLATGAVVAATGGFSGGNSQLTVPENPNNTANLGNNELEQWTQEAFSLDGPETFLDVEAQGQTLQGHLTPQQNTTQQSTNIPSGSVNDSALQDAWRQLDEAKEIMNENFKRAGIGKDKKDITDPKKDMNLFNDGISYKNNPQYASNPGLDGKQEKYHFDPGLIQGGYAAPQA